MKYQDLIEGHIYEVLNYGHCVLLDKPNLCFMPLDEKECFLANLNHIQAI